jgi:Protein of unknown function (DUF3239)
LALVALSVFANSLYWVYVKEHYTADSNGGVVVSVDPPLVAVLTDLAVAGGSYPAIKIIKYKVKRKISIGDKVATVSTYKWPEEINQHYWDDFFPWPVEYATNNAADIKKELDGYSSDDWCNLSIAIDQLDKPYKVGLFRVELRGGEWARKTSE